MGRLDRALARANQLIQDLNDGNERERAELGRHQQRQSYSPSASQQGHYTAAHQWEGQQPHAPEMPPRPQQKEPEAEARAAFGQLALTDDGGQWHQKQIARELREDRKEVGRYPAQCEVEHENEKAMAVQEAIPAHSSTVPPLPPRQASAYQIATVVQQEVPDGSERFSAQIKPEETQGSRPSAPLSPPQQDKPSQAERHLSGIAPVTECVDQPLDLPLQWATHAQATSFAVCTRCYVDHIYDSCFRDGFSVRTIADGSPRRCLFGVSRMKDQLWPEALKTRDFSKALRFMCRRQALEHCPSTAFVENRSWYTTSQCPGLAICEACFEDDVAASPFAGRFTLESVPTGVSCDMAVPCVKRTFELCSSANDWEHFSADAAARIQMPPCPKQEVVDAARYAWFDARNISVCLACYCDYFANTESQDLFRQGGQRTGNMRCALGDLNILLMIQEAASRKDHSVFWDGMLEMARNPWCDPAGVEGANWYGLVDGPRQFAVCGRCVAGIFKPHGTERFLVLKSAGSVEEPFLCAFNIAHPRLAGHLSALVESLLKGHPKALQDFAFQLSGVPPCPRLDYEASKNKRWWGWDHATICEECYVTFAKGLGLDSQFEIRGVLDSRSRMCDVYSPRMRNLYLQACKTNDLAGFLDAAKHRRQVYIEAYLPAQQLEQQQWIAVMKAKNDGVMGTVYKSMGWSQDAVVGHSYTLGNAQVGYGHVNELAFQGAVYDLESERARAQASDPSTHEAIRQLRTRWASVE